MPFLNELLPPQFDIFHASPFTSNLGLHQFLPFTLDHAPQLSLI